MSTSRHTLKVIQRIKGYNLKEIQSFGKHKTQWILMKEKGCWKDKKELMDRSWVGQKIHDEFSVRSYRKTWTDFLVNPIHGKHLGKTCFYYYYYSGHIWENLAKSLLAGWEQGSSQSIFYLILSRQASPMPPTLLTDINAMEIIIEIVPCQATMDEELCPCCHHHVTMSGGWRFSMCLWLWPGQGVWKNKSHDIRWQKYEAKMWGLYLSLTSQQVEMRWTESGLGVIHCDLPAQPRPPSIHNLYSLCWCVSRTRELTT